MCNPVGYELAEGRCRVLRRLSGCLDEADEHWPVGIQRRPCDAPMAAHPVLELCEDLRKSIRCWRLDRRDSASVAQKREKLADAGHRIAIHASAASRASVFCDQGIQPSSVQRDRLETLLLHPPAKAVDRIHVQADGDSRVPVLPQPLGKAVEERSRRTRPQTLPRRRGLEVVLQHDVLSGLQKPGASRPCSAEDIQDYAELSTGSGHPTTRNERSDPIANLRRPRITRRCA
jgi:hypothetical protein